MLIRASIVLLIALNLGVAAWWLLRDAPPPPAPEPLPAGASVGIPAWPTVVADVQGRTWAPVLEACGLTKVVTGGRQALAPEGRLLTTVAAADFKDSPS